MEKGILGKIRHGSTTTTHAVRVAIQRPQASLVTLSRELGSNPKTVAKWCKHRTVVVLKTGPQEPHSTVLTEAEEATIVAFRRYTLLPLDDCPYALQPSIPHLTRSALHRCPARATVFLDLVIDTFRSLFLKGQSFSRASDRLTTGKHLSVWLRSVPPRIRFSNIHVLIPVGATRIRKPIRRLSDLS